MLSDLQHGGGGGGTDGEEIGGAGAALGVFHEVLNEVYLVADFAEDDDTGEIESLGRDGESGLGEGEFVAGHIGWADTDGGAAIGTGDEDGDTTGGGFDHELTGEGEGGGEKSDVADEGEGNFGFAFSIAADEEALAGSAEVGAGLGDDDFFELLAALC